MIEFYAKFINTGNLVFDVGANIGNRVETFLALGRHVVVVEPDEDCLIELREKFGNNSRVSIVCKAVGAAPGQAEILTSIENPKVMGSLSQSFIDTVTRSQRFGDEEWSRHFWNKKKQVEVTTLDLLIKEFGFPDFIKMDIEGYEQEALKGLSQRVAGLSFEFHPELLGPAFECIDRCEALGMNSFNCSLMETFAFNNNWMTGQAMKEHVAQFKGNNKLYGDIYAVS